MTSHSFSFEEILYASFETRLQRHWLLQILIIKLSEEHMYKNV